MEELRREMVIGRAKSTVAALVGIQDEFLLPTTFSRQLVEPARARA